MLCTVDSVWLYTALAYRLVLWFELSIIIIVAHSNGRPLCFAAVVSISFLLFFLAYSQWSEIGCLLYFHTWCGGLSANLESMSGMCCNRTTLSGCIFALQLRHVSTVRKKLVKQQYLLQMSPQYGELRPTNGSDRFVSLWHASKFQRVSRLSFVTAATSLTGGQPNFARCLPFPGLVHYIYIFVGSFCTLTGFCPVQNSLYIQVLRSSILAALLHGTPAAGVSQSLRRGTRNGITELSLGDHHVGHWRIF